MQENRNAVVMKAIEMYLIGVLMGLVFTSTRADDTLNSGFRSPSSNLPGIVGRDDRVPLDSTAWPWQAIGRFNQPEGASYCTGTLVGPDTVLTAAHCVFDRKARRWLQPEELVFVADFRRDEDAGFAHGKAILRSPQADPHVTTLDTISHDWAIVKLEHALPVRPVKVRSLLEMNASDLAALRLETAGYAQDRPYLLSLDDGCAVHGLIADSQVMVTDCDSTNGDSGAPLLLRQGKDFWLVGVFSASTVAGAKKPGSYAVSASVFIDRLPE
jgi:protease YdgD